jgi:hypothetical protein
MSAERINLVCVGGLSESLADNSKEQNQKTVSEQKKKQSLNQQLAETDRENGKRDQEQAKVC